MLRREKSSVLAKAAADEAATTSGEESNETAAAAAVPGGEDTSSAAETTRRESAAATAAASGWGAVKHAPSQLGSKNDLIVWLPLRPAQRRLYQQFLKSGPVRAALNKTGSALSAINVLKKICDHPALCCAITGASAADAAASSTFTR